MQTGQSFPPIESALSEPNGLLAVGGELGPERLLEAYCAGIFPWYEQGQPVLWWSPDPRAVIEPAGVRVSRSLRRSMRRNDYRLSFNCAFERVIESCAAPRADSEGTWITPAMQSAYVALHRRGYAHSLEIWRDEILVGGLYGVAIGRLFCGESMFSRETDTSKIAFVALCRLLLQRDWPLLDCQLPNPHLHSLGVGEMRRVTFKRYLPADARSEPTRSALGELPWRDSAALLEELR